MVRASSPDMTSGKFVLFVLFVLTKIFSLTTKRIQKSQRLSRGKAKDTRGTLIQLNL